MRKLWLILQREYVVRVRTKAFVIFTVLMPLLVGAVVVLPSKLMMQSGGSKQHRDRRGRQHSGRRDEERTLGFAHRHR